MNKTILVCAVWVLSCGAPFEAPEADCGSDSGFVVDVIDGDTFDLEDGRRIRLILVDAPELSTSKSQCYAEEAKETLHAVAWYQPVQLSFDTQCVDQFERTLAYASVNKRSINQLLLERGAAQLLHIPPNGTTEVAAYRQMEEKARRTQRGLWSACSNSSL